MTGVVVDTSAIVEILTAPEPNPEPRRRERYGLVTAEQVARSVSWLTRTPIGLMPPRPFVSRVWQTCHAVTPYDASYVALAEQLRVPLVTTDTRPAGSNSHRTEVERYPASRLTSRVRPAGAAPGRRPR